MIKIINILFFMVLVAIYFLVSSADNNIPRRNKKVILVLFVTILTIFLGFRNIGLDLEPYRALYNNQSVVNFREFFSSNMFANKLEPFFILLISVIKDLNLNFNTFLILAGGIPLFIVFKVIIDSEKRNVLMVFLFFLMLHFLKGPVDIIRHFFAASIYLSALYSLSKKEKIKFWWKAIFSVFVHYSNIVVLGIRPFFKIKWSLTKFYLSCLIVLIIGFFAKTIILNVSFADTTLMNNQIFWKAHYYLTYYNVEGYQYSGLGHKILSGLINFFPLVFNIVFILLILRKVKYEDIDRFHIILLKSQILGSLIAIFFISLNASTLGMRLHFLLSIGNFFLVKEVIFNYYKENKVLVFTLTVLSLIVYNFLIILYFAGVHDPNSPFNLF